jgi:hypothetical protein
MRVAQPQLARLVWVPHLFGVKDAVLGVFILRTDPILAQRRRRARS